VLGEFQPKGREVIQGYYPQIITQSEFDAARTQIRTKTRRGTYVGGNRKNSLLANNLFEGLLFDITTEPIRTMQFQDSRNIHYVMSAFDRGDRRSNRIRLDKLEKAITGFFFKVIWPDIASEIDSDVQKAAMAGLEVVKRERDIVARRLSPNGSRLSLSDKSHWSIDRLGSIARGFVKDFFKVHA
jgi:hypothetical protein